MKSKKKIAIIAGIIALVVLSAGVIGAAAYNNMDSVKLKRQMDLGQRYLEELNYEQAIAAFQAVIEIDPMSTEAYLGMAEAYIGLEDTENAIAILRQGYEAAGQNEEIRQMLIDVCMQEAKNCTETEDYGKALEYYDFLLELDGGNEQVLSELEACLIQYLKILMDEGRYEEIRQLYEKYGEVVSADIFQEYLDAIEEIERIAAENQEFMQTVYDLMEAKDYDGLQALEETEELQAFLDRMEGEHFIYIPEDDGSATGTGAGIYRLSEDSCYFFYGQYEAGIRSGEGNTFNTNSFGGYSEFSGEWKDDAPNGEGTQMFQRYMGATGEGYQEIFSGNLVNGLFDGTMINTTVMSGITYDMSVNVTMGVPEDKTDELAAQLPYVVQTIPEGYYAYAYDNQNGNWYFSTIAEGDTMGVIGFRKE